MNKSTNSFSKKVAFVMAWVLLFQAILPAPIFALTAGPSQPEFNSFEPVSTTQMVDPFSGSFVYNIPLFELPGPNGGYPFNLSYKPEGGGDAESGPFGFGWTINPGIITRDVRGIPDDASGELTTITSSIKDNWTAGLDVSSDIVEALGLAGFDLGFGVYYNSYRGVGANASLGVALSVDKMDSSVGLDLSLDSQEGFGLSPSIALHNVYRASTSINSRRGMSGLTLTQNVKMDETETAEGDKPKDKTKGEISGETSNRSVYGTTISLAGGSNLPSLDMPWNSFSLSGKVKLGGSLFGLFANGAVGGSFSRQSLKKKGKPVGKASYGFLNFDKIPSGNLGRDALLDFSREKDGPIRAFSPNLGIAATTPDIYTAVGQGMVGMFRPFRSDIGVLYDPEVNSDGGGGTFSFDAPFMHAGGSGSLSFNTSKSGRWEENKGNNLLSKVAFQSNVGHPLIEPYYFKAQGEKVSEPLDAIDKYVGGEKAIQPAIGLNVATGNYTNDDNAYITVGVETGTIRSQRSERKPRGLVIQNFSNKMAGEIPVLNNDYYTTRLDLSNYDLNIARGFAPLPTSVPYERAENDFKKDDHLGGFVSTDTKGLRYVYGIPAYNKVKEEYIFSVAKLAGTCNALVDVVTSDGELDYKIEGTDKFLKKTEHPSFAHSFLLTSVLGADYIDVDDNGPSVNDLGYWVKFNYAKTQDNYKWRSPYNRAFYDEGIKIKDSDDKGSFVYGEKEIWMLGTVETKTHIAVFLTQEREDGRDAVGRFVNTGMGGSTLDLVKEIRLYTRSAFENREAPLRTVHFNHEYAISSGVPNSGSAEQKKLALTQVWFTSENSSRGTANKYQFDYGLDGPNGFNPPYDPTGFDRWGTYIPTGTDDCGNLEFPYTQQSPEVGQSWGNFNVEMNRRASAWNLKAVTLPSGAKIKVDWEAKTYSHVQDRLATQMVKIKSLGQSGSVSNILSQEGPESVKIYFEPEVNPDDPNGDFYPVENYLEDLHIGDKSTNRRQIYYKARVRLVKIGGNAADDYVDTNHPEIYQDVSGYLNVLGAGEENGWYYIECEKLRKKGGGTLAYHPISVAAWHFMKLQIPEALMRLPQMPETATEGDGVSLVKKLAGSLKAITGFLGKFYDSCESKNFANRIDQNHSYIKLTCPDKEKIGGGARVAQVTLEEEWDAQQTGGNSYGQRYEYSGGVTPNEPAIGGDENALRYGKVYPNNLPLASDEYYFFEYPVNENLYPGPSVGYEKVEVKSLATHLASLPTAAQPSWLPDGIATTGKVVHEFYTAKDFPVVTDETDIDKKQFKLKMLMFPMGNFNTEKLTASQGFSIVKNDMHGKPKKIANYAQDVQGNFMKEPYNWVKYNYKHKEITEKGRNIKVLDNEVAVLTDYDPQSVGNNLYEMPTENQLMGVDYEMVNDMRRSRSVAANIGKQFNADFIPFPPGFPIPSFWMPSTFDEVTTTTASTNKMIFKSGILESVEAFDGGSYVATKNLLFDPYTGSALLTEVTNSYGDPIYNLGVPAHMVYDGMGPAYKNIDLSFLGTINFDPACALYSVGMPSAIKTELVPGDEFILAKNFSFGGNGLYEEGKATFVRVQDGNYLFDIDREGSTTNLDEFEFLCVRSGRRNQMEGGVGSITALSDPTKMIAGGNCQLSIERPIWTEHYMPNPDFLLAIDLINLLLANNDFYEDGSGNDFIDLTVSPYNEITEYLNTKSCYPTTHFKRSSLNGAIKFYIIKNGNLGQSYLDMFNVVGSCTENIGIGFTPPTGAGRLIEINNLRSGTNCAYPFIGLLDFNFENNNIIVEGVLSDVWQTSGSDGCGELIPALIVDPDVEVEIIEDNNKFVQYKIINDILNINAATYSDTWETGTNASVSNPYKTGEKGIWRGEAAYALVDDRVQSGDGDVGIALDLQQDGILNGVPLFDYHNPFFADCSDSKWQRTSLATQYSGENALESKDAIGIYSTALFGYNNSLPIAVANNARNKEIAFESFEEFEATSIEALGYEGERNSGHFDILSSNNEYIFDYESYELISGQRNVIVLDKPFQSEWNPNSIKLRIVFEDGSTIFTDAFIPPGGAQETDNGNTYLILQYDEGCTPAMPNGGGFEYALWKGTVYVQKAYSNQGLVITQGLGNPEICENCLDAYGKPIDAHTGKKYLKVPQGVRAEFFIQSLRLEKGKKYLFSAWVRRGHQMHPGTYRQMVLINGRSSSIASSIINDWVKIENVFTAQNEGVLVNFLTQTVLVFTADGQASTVASPVFLDDIRIQPMESSMATHVYDPINFRLKASLDENNFATFYEYDEEGRLTTLKKETERGIKTIQNNQSHLAAQPSN